MFQNYLKTALRNLWRKKSSTLINIGGLSLGVAGSIVLFLIIRYHTSFDLYHSKGDRIYRIVHGSKDNTGDNFTSGIQSVLPEAFKNDFPEAEQVLFTFYQAGALVTIPSKDGSAPAKYSEGKGVTYSGPEYFRMFDRKVIVGDAFQSLDEPNEAVISESLARKYFKEEDPIGKIVRFDGADYRVGAVVDDAPSNTDLPFDLMLSYITVKKKLDEQGWNSIWSDQQCYFLLKEGENISNIEARMPDFVKKYRDANDANRSFYVIQPLKTLHSDERFGNYNYNTMEPSVLTTLSWIAVFLVITACINFVNLATAEAIKRAKEVGVRKSLGSTRGQLMGQFLGETAIVTFFSVAVGLALAQMGMTFLNPFLGLDLSLDLLGNPTLLLFIIGLGIVVSLFSGLYPSFVLSAFNPASALKGTLNSKSGSGYILRRSLVVVQFFISQLLIIGTLVLVNQMTFLTSKDLGFKKEAIINISIPEPEQPVAGGGTSKMRALKNEILSIAGVEQASLNNSPPSSGSVSATNFKIEGLDEDFGAQIKNADNDYIPMFGIKLLEGENVQDLDTAQGFVVNERLVASVGITNPKDIIGKELRTMGRRLRVVGVVKDFHTMSLSEPIEAVIILNRIRGYGNLSVKLSGNDLQNTIKQIQSKWEAMYPDAIFGYEFMEEEIKNFYEGQNRMSVVLGISTGMAIFIGCLGLLGLATYMANQKNKEIGIRKVLGASVGSIIMNFSKEFIVLIIIGFAIAAPVGWYVMSEFLSQFEYRIDLGPSIFISGMVATLLIAAITVGHRSFKAATVNPVESLKSE